MPDILLVQPPIRDFYLTAKRTIPYGLACIAGVLREAGFSVQILDALATRRTKTVAPPAEMAFLDQFYGRADRSPFSLFHGYKHYGLSYAAISRIARSSGAWLVGVSSLFSPYADMAEKTAELVRSALPESVVVLGGHHPTAMPEAAMASPSVDYVLRGEGEASLPLLARALRRGEPMNGVPGAVWREANGDLVTRPPAVAGDLNRLPLPDLGLVDLGYYRRGDRGAATLVASRGCPMACSYCCMGSDSYQTYRRRSVGSVLAEIEDAVVRHGAGFVDFEDENISLDRKWFLQLLEAIEARFGRRQLELRAMNGLFPPSLDREVVQAMQKAGFDTLNLSLGATGVDQLRRFRRPDVRAAFDRALDLAESVGISSVGYVIAGAPFQRPEDSLADLVYLAQRRVLAGLSIFYPAPGSRDFECCDRMGLLPDSLLLMRSSGLPISHTTTRLETATLLRLARILNFIKSLIDQRIALPDARPIPSTQLDGITDRTEAGKLLLAAFFHDGRVRGVSPQGQVFEHTVCLDMTRRFVRCLNRVRVRGANR